MNGVRPIGQFFAHWESPILARLQQWKYIQTPPPKMAGVSSATSNAPTQESKPQLPKNWEVLEGYKDDPA